ncbi:MAG TPA: PLP-dependent transferase [Gaiellaceae bacterium]|nr:PLP-dependent transferase [Gaiellaceae bacterium]
MSPVPLDRSALWPYEDGEPGDFYYSRYGHPTGAAAEEALGALDGGEALLFGSGSAAETAVLLGLLDPGSTVGVTQGGYFGTVVLMRYLERWGLRFVEFDQAGPPPDGVDLIWLEAPSNPMLTFPDLEAAAAHPAPVIVDATASSPILLRPLEHGADLVLHSATKYLGGHSDVLLGAVVCRDDTHHTRLLELRNRTGVGAAADPAWLLLRSLETLDLRVRRQSATALELARRLAADPRVAQVRYPGLGNPLAERWMEGGFGGLLSFDVAAGEEAARRVETATRLITNATSLGGTSSLIESRYRWESDRVPPNLLRLSVGLEEVEALWSDLDQALGA